MEERYFILTEGRSKHNNSIVITETELAARIDAMIRSRLRDSTPTRELIPILIHGKACFREMPRG